MKITAQQRKEYKEFADDFVTEEYPGQSVMGPDDAPPTIEDWVAWHREQDDHQSDEGQFGRNK